MRIDGREESLSGAFPNGRSGVYTQFTQLGVKTHPHLVGSRHRTVILGQLIPSVLGFLQFLEDVVSILGQEVRNVPLERNSV